MRVCRRSGLAGAQQTRPAPRCPAEGTDEHTPRVPLPTAQRKTPVPSAPGIHVPWDGATSVWTVAAVSGTSRRKRRQEEAKRPEALHRRAQRGLSAPPAHPSRREGPRKAAKQSSHAKRCSVPRRCIRRRNPQPPLSPPLLRHAHRRRGRLRRRKLPGRAARPRSATALEDPHSRSIRAARRGGGGTARPRLGRACHSAPPARADSELPGGGSRGSGGGGGARPRGRLPSAPPGPARGAPRRHGRIQPRRHAHEPSRSWRSPKRSSAGGRWAALGRAVGRAAPAGPARGGGGRGRPGAQPQDAPKVLGRFS